jgi:hypothetical protein
MPNFFLKNWFSTFCILLAFVFRLQGQTGAFAELDSVVETGNPFVLHLYIPDVLGITPQDVDFSPWDSIFPAENILSQSDWQLNARGYEKDVILIAFDADSLLLPPLAIRLKGGGQALSNPLQLSIIPTPSPDDLRDMADIKDIRREPFSWRAWLYAYRVWILLLLGVLALALIAYQVYKRKIRSTATLSRSIQLPAHTYALRRLEALESRQLWQNEQPKWYYAELTHIIREYLEKRYQVPALESVSDEILRQLHHTDFPPALVGDLQKLLTEADLAKFAQSTPPVSFHPQALQIARIIVAETMEKQVVESNPAP